MIFLKKTLLSIPLTLALRVNIPLVKDVPTPVKDGVITSQFGKRLHPIAKVTRFHTGIDIAGVKDSKALSVGSGIVVYAGNIEVMETLLFLVIVTEFQLTTRI